jgi:4-amino-4-deoxy-L-arabinose transferase-like glycosyltransferase
VVLPAAARAGRAHGVLRALFIATNAHFFHYGYAATTDALALVLQAGAFYLLLAGTAAGARCWRGLLSACAFLTRYNASTCCPRG